MSIGWYLVWKIFLSRFKFVQELVGMTQDLTTKEKNAKLSDTLSKNTLGDSNAPRKRRVRLEWIYLCIIIMIIYNIIILCIMCYILYNYNIIKNILFNND